MASLVSTCRLATRKLKLETASRGYTASAICLAKSESTSSKKQTYPLLPSVEHLLHENGLDASSIEKMTPTGPNNRLLKGDVLAFLGSIPSTYPTELSSRIEKLSHLDLSNIKLASSPPPPPQAATTSTPEEPLAIPQDTKVATSISLAKVLNVQKRIHRTLGVHLPLSTFIARATDLANDHLPRSAPAKPSAEELFNAVLGLDKLVPEGVRGNFQPQITALPHAASLPSSPSSRKAELDIIDFLAGKKAVKATQRKGLTSSSGEEDTAASIERNIFAVTAARGEEKRARVFLERVKAVLEGEPGRLVL